MKRRGRQREPSRVQIPSSPSSYSGVKPEIYHKGGSMATVSIHYNCGCGFSTENVAEAVLHSDSLNHSLDVVGKISKDRKPDKIKEE